MSTQEEITDSSYKLNKNSPTLFNSYIGKETTVTTTDKNIHYGVVYTVDPVSERLEELLKLFYLYLILSIIKHL